MPESLAVALVWLLQAYLVAGVVVAVAFQLGGASRLDRAARGSTWGFRILITPGVVALWPLLVGRLLRGTGRPPSERNAHRDAALERGNGP